MQVLFSTSNVLAKSWQWEKAGTHVAETWVFTGSEGILSHIGNKICPKI